jgi:hypothetical protein
MQKHGIQARGKRKFRVTATTEEGWLLLAVVIDLFSRKVIVRSIRAKYGAQPGD